MSFAFRNLTPGFICFFLLLTIGSVYSQNTVICDFEDCDPGLIPAGDTVCNWEAVDDVDLDPGNAISGWTIRRAVTLDGNAVFQGSNIWGDKTDSCLMGTFLLYKGRKFSNFRMEIDVAAYDNDGQGLVWAYEDTDKHYRVIMMNDKWPDPNPVDGVGGPFVKIAKRISNENPWYELLEVVKAGYKPFAEQAKTHWVLEVVDGEFTFTRDDGVEITAQDPDYTEGYVGIQIYAQQSEFDNIIITNLAAAVHPSQKVATLWGAIRRDQ